MVDCRRAAAASRIIAADDRAERRRAWRRWTSRIARRWYGGYKPPLAPFGPREKLGDSETLFRRIGHDGSAAQRRNGRERSRGCGGRPDALCDSFSTFGVVTRNCKHSRYKLSGSSRRRGDRLGCLPPLNRGESADGKHRRPSRGAARPRLVRAGARDGASFRRRRKGRLRQRALAHGVRLLPRRGDRPRPRRSFRD